VATISNMQKILFRRINEATVLQNRVVTHFIIAICEQQYY
jgi:hypothetical protein